MIQSPTLPQAGLDRLSAFFGSFPLEVTAVPAGEHHAGPMLYLAVAADGAPRALHLVVRGKHRPTGPVLAARVDFGGSQNPLVASLPARISVALDAGQPLLRDAAHAFAIEVAAGRCGHRHALSRLGELMVLWTLRAAIERGTTRACLLAGLAHPQLRTALVAMHESPARAWRIDELADLAGMSRSRFMAAFPRTVGTTPMTYLTRWRVQLGRRELQREGARVKSVAHRVGFASAEAFSRAYQREFGRAPVQELLDGRASRHGEAA